LSSHLQSFSGAANRDVTLASVCLHGFESLAFWLLGSWALLTHISSDSSSPTCPRHYQRRFPPTFSPHRPHRPQRLPHPSHPSSTRNPALRPNGVDHPYLPSVWDWVYQWTASSSDTRAIRARANPSRRSSSDPSRVGMSPVADLRPWGKAPSGQAGRCRRGSRRPEMKAKRGGQRTSGIKRRYRECGASLTSDRVARQEHR
jgi:hypothetical protein